MCQRELGQIAELTGAVNQHSLNLGLGAAMCGDGLNTCNFQWFLEKKKSHTQKKSFCRCT